MEFCVAWLQAHEQASEAAGEQSLADAVGGKNSSSPDPGMLMPPLSGTRFLANSSHWRIAWSAASWQVA